VHIATWHWAFAICMMLVLMMFMIAACTDNEHKPDYGADEKGFTDAGVIHLFYLGINMFVISIAVCLASDGQISGLPLYCITAGGIFYGITQMLDFRAGHYAQGA